MLVKKWNVRLLGKIDASSGANNIGRFATRHAAILFAFLCRSAGRRVSRDQLVDLLWPDVDLVTGRTRLRVALASLRKRLEPPGTLPGTVLLSDRDGITLRSESCDIDANEFRYLVTQGLCATAPDQALKLLKRAGSLYQGPFCTTIDHAWIEQERDSLLSAHISAQLEISNLLLAQGELPGAVAHARRAVESDPLSEPARQALLRSLMVQGNKDAALLEYDDFSRTLRTEVGVAPSRPTSAILTQVAPRRAEVGSDSSLIQTPEPGANLPRFFDEYIHRSGEFDHLEELVLSSRVVSLLGPVGIGKTRLAVEFVRHLAERGSARAWFAATRPEENRSLSELLFNETGWNPRFEDPITELRRLDARDAVGDAVTRLIVIIDDAHRLGPGFRQEIRDLLTREPRIHVLLTSHGKVGIVGEQEVQVGPLEFPTLGPCDFLELSGNACIRLFVARARSVHPEFHLTRANAKDLTRICRALEGIPLAIELAASQVRKFPLATLFDHVCIPEPGDFDSWRHPKHRSLHSAFRVNRDALSPQEVESLALLTVFEGSWTIEASSVVLSVQDPQAVLDRLVAHALLVTEPSHHGVRYRMLGSVKQFASQETSEEVLARAKRRHARYFLQVARTFAAGIGEGGFSLQRLSVLDRDNLDAALGHLLGHQESHWDAAIMAGALTWYWIFTGTLSLGFKAIRSIAPLVDASGETITARLAIAEGILECFGPAPARAIGLLGANVDRLEVSADPWLQGYARWGLGFATYAVGNYAVSRLQLETAIELFEELDSDWWSACSQHLLGFTLLALGDASSAIETLQKSIDLWHECGERYISVASQMGLARVAWVAGRLESAKRDYVECFEVYRKSGDFRMATFCLEGLARVACSAGHFVESARLFGLAERTREDFSLQLDYTDSAAHSACAVILRRELKEKFDDEWSLGRSANWSSYLSS